METAIIDRLQQFLLELGKGFLFEARQKRFSFDDSHFFVDLVFYNRLLRCYVLIDFKTGKLTHQDLGQMQQIEEREEFLERADALAATTSGVKPTDGTILIREDRDR
ncbi:MAG: PDDEXK nuclease domain-containing protein [Gemmatimonadota bacterium]|nr:PDDEXK nuclease domain-containing protein [Gemmatimonadota bacterium]MDE2863474.1 PDDEXK nuclease domain-containing protein [Gemmatimonadota bacterium]